MQRPPARANSPGLAPKLAVSLSAVLTVVTGSMILVGWALDSTVLKSILPGWVSVKPNTALAFILLGIALLSFSLAPATSNHRLPIFLSRLARLCGWLAGLIGLATLGEYAFDWNPGIDQWLFPEPAGTVGTKIPGRMAPETALCFLLLAAGLELARDRHQRSRETIAALMFGLLVTTLALAAILTYYTPALGAYGWFGQTIMAVPTAALFAVLGATLVQIAWQSNVSIWSLGKRNTAAFACGLALLVIIGLTTSRYQVQLHETNNQLAHIEKALGGIATILAEIADARSHSRSYIITRDERFLTSYFSARTRSYEALDALRQLLADDPPLQPLFARIETQTREALEWFHVTATCPDCSVAVLPDRINHGEDLVDGIRAVIGQMSEEQRRLLEQTRQERENVAWVTDTVIVTGTAFSLIVFLSTILALNHTVAGRIRAEAEIRRLNEGLEARVRERTAQLESSNTALTQFAYIASHDLQEPLRMVVGYVQLLEKRLAGKLDAETREFMGFAVGGALRMQQLIHDILLYSRVSTRGEPLAPVDSAAALKEALASLAGRIAETGAEVEAPSLPIVMADRTQLAQLFQNLIGNAIKFCQVHAPRIRVGATQEARRWRFSVTDNGIGIAPEYRGQLFAIFKRLHTQREYPGTGVGLAICKRIVERHGGEIGIDAAPGGGSVFWFTLPEEASI